MQPWCAGQAATEADGQELGGCAGAADAPEGADGDARRSTDSTTPAVTGEEIGLLGGVTGRSPSRASRKYICILGVQSLGFSHQSLGFSHWGSVVRVQSSGPIAVLKEAWQATLTSVAAPRLSAAAGRKPGYVFALMIIDLACRPHMPRMSRE